MNRLFRSKHTAAPQIRIVQLEELSPPGIPLPLVATQRPGCKPSKPSAEPPDSRPEQASGVKPGGIYAAIKAMHAMPRRVDAPSESAKRQKITKPKRTKGSRRLYDDGEEQELRTSISLANDHDSEEEDSDDDWGSLADMIDDRDFSDDE